MTSAATAEAQLAAMNRLHELSSRLLACTNLNTALDEVLDAAIAIHGADMGHVQLYNRQLQALEIVTQRGFGSEFLDFFRRVDAEHDSACGRVLKSGQRVLVEDVQTDPVYEPCRQVAAAAGYRAVQATPLRCRNHELLGVITTHFRRPHCPAECDLRMLDLYGAMATDFIQRVRAEEALKEADRRKDEFLAMLGHELRNPLAPIHNTVETLRLLHPSEGRLHEAYDLIDRQVTYLSRLVDDLLDVSRITRGLVALHREPVDLAGVVGHAAELARGTLEEQGHTVTIALPPQPVTLDADPTRLTQVVFNLLHNAAKYTPPGGQIILTAERDGSALVLHVRDTGVGMSAALLAHVFDLFTQGERTPDRAPGGLGLGLTLVKRLVELHGGTVVARSTGPGRGSEFIVRLPTLPGAVAEPARPRAAVAPAAPRPARILVVDDNVDVADSLAALLKELGHDVRMAHAGPQALELAQDFRPEVVLLDIGLPGMDGYEVARRLRREPGPGGVLLVALSGYGQEEDRRRSREAGFDEHVVKPMKLATLQGLLGRLGPADGQRPVGERQALTR
jgi:signal transduction histidine kinase/CheY-like chemotaxis protein